MSDTLTPPHPRTDTNELGFTYVQGMNVLAAPFLYVMPSEVEAFACFTAFIEKSCPLYVQPTLEGVHRGLKVSCHCQGISFVSGRFSLTQEYRFSQFCSWSTSA